MKGIGVKILSLLVLLASFGANAEIILDKKINTELMASSNIPYHEVFMERVDFQTTQQNEEVTINISIPFSGHIVGGDAASNAIRVYLDGNSYYNYSYASYWNGEMLLNSGAFPHIANLPQIGHLSGSIRKIIAMPGTHSIYVQSSGGSLGTASTIKSERRYQVWK